MKTHDLATLKAEIKAADGDEGAMSPLAAWEYACEHGLLDRREAWKDERKQWRYIQEDFASALSDLEVGRGMWDTTRRAWAAAASARTRARRMKAAATWQKELAKRAADAAAEATRVEEVRPSRDSTMVATRARAFAAQKAKVAAELELRQAGDAREALALENAAAAFAVRGG